MKAQGGVPAAPSKGDHFLLLVSQRTYYVPGLLCQSLCFRAPLHTPPGSLIPSVPSVQPAPSLGNASLLWPVFLKSHLSLLGLKLLPLFPSKTTLHPKPYLLHEDFAGRMLPILPLNRH